MGSLEWSVRPVAAAPGSDWLIARLRLLITTGSSSDRPETQLGLSVSNWPVLPVAIGSLELTIRPVATAPGSD